VTGVTSGLRVLLGRLTAHRVRSWSESYGVTPAPGISEEDQTPDLLRADIVSSTLRDGSGHVLMLDVDYPVYHVPSTAQGHGHLYFDMPKPLTTEAMAEIVTVLGKYGVIEEGYAGASVRRGYTSLRPPWSEKGRPILRCVRCQLRPDEIGEYLPLNQPDQPGVSPDDFVWNNEGSLCRATGQFACTACYIAIGMPNGTADTYNMFDF
jgi:hypothetical protein